MVDDLSQGRIPKEKSDIALSPKIKMATKICVTYFLWILKTRHIVWRVFNPHKNKIRLGDIVQQLTLRM